MVLGHNDEFEGLKVGILQVVTELKAAMENQTELLKQVVQNVTQLQGTCNAFILDKNLRCHTYV